MASALPKLQFKTVKVRLANTEEKEEYEDAMKDQSADLLAFVRKNKDAEPSAEVEVKAPGAGLKPMFGKPKAKAKEVVEPKKAKEPTLDEAKPLAPEEYAPQLPMAQIEKYSEPVQEHAIEILASEYENPYEDKSLNHIYPIFQRVHKDSLFELFYWLGFQTF